MLFIYLSCAIFFTPLLASNLEWLSWPNSVIGCEGEDITLQWSYNMSHAQRPVALSIYHTPPHWPMSKLILIHVLDKGDKPREEYQNRISYIGNNVSQPKVQLLGLRKEDSGQYEIGLSGPDLSEKTGHCTLIVIPVNIEISLWSKSAKPLQHVARETETFNILVNAAPVSSNVSCWTSTSLSNKSHVCTPPCVLLGEELTLKDNFITCKVQSGKCIRQATINITVISENSTNPENIQANDIDLTRVEQSDKSVLLKLLFVIIVLMSTMLALGCYVTLALQPPYRMNNQKMIEKEMDEKKEKDEKKPDENKPTATNVS